MLRRIYKPAILIPCICLTISAWGQLRHCDMALTLLTPQNGAVIPAYATFDVQVKIQNLGPDSILTGDTLFYNLPTFLLTDYHAFPFPQSIPPGGHANFTLQSITNVNNNPQDETTDFCVMIESNPFAWAHFADTVFNNNRDCDSVTFGATTGIKNVSATKTLFSIYPNPVENQLNISWENAGSQMPEKCIIRDLEGRTVLEFTPQRDVQPLSIPVQKLPSGMYFLDIWTNKQHTIQKFVKI